MLDRTELAARLDSLMAEEGQIFVATVPYATHLTDGGPLDEAYYLRHRIETVHRIRLTARTDALALARMIEEDYEAARAWARYACEELDHDRLFLEDLARHGVEPEVVTATPALPATTAMMAYLDEQLARVGSLAAVAYSVFVEWNSARYSKPAVQKAARRFSDAHVAQSRAHLDIDETEDHYTTMVEIAHRLLAGQESEEVLFTLVRDFAAFFRRYFEELHAVTVARIAAA